MNQQTETTREYPIPIGTLIRRCECGARVVEIDLVAIEYKGGSNFDYWGVEHKCSSVLTEATPVEATPKMVQPEEVKPEPAKPEPVKRGELQGAFCKGKNCGKIIYFRKTESGASTPVNADGTPHWATCADEKQFKQKRESSTRLDETPSLWNGENTSPGQQIESRKTQARNE